VAERFRFWGLNILWQLVGNRTISKHPDSLHPDAELASGRVLIIGGRFPDLWEAVWEEAFEAEVRRRAKGREEDPTLLDYFVDNELP